MSAGNKAWASRKGGLSGWSKEEKEALGEARGVMQHYEADYKSDLAVHLYSAYMLHKIDPRFPARGYTAWPVPVEELYHPSTIQTYTNDPEKINSKHNERRIRVPKEKFKLRKDKDTKNSKAKSRIRSQQFVVDSGSEEDDEPVRETRVMIDEGDEEARAETPMTQGDEIAIKLERLEGEGEGGLEDIPWAEYAAVDLNHDSPEPVEENEPVVREPPESAPYSDPDELLRVEIEALFKRKIYDKIHKFGSRTYDVQPTLDHMKMPEFVFDHVQGKLDALVSKFGTITSDRYSLDWQNVLLGAAVKNEQFNKKVTKLFTTTADEFLEEHRKRDEEEALGRSDESDDGDERPKKRVPLPPKKAVRLRELEKEVLDRINESTAPITVTDDLNFDTYKVTKKYVW